MSAASACLARLRDDAEIAKLIDRLVGLSIDGLGMMYVRDARRFVFSHKRRPEGWANTDDRSDRYTAIALIGLAGVSEARQRAVLGDSAEEVCADLIDSLPGVDELGTVALGAWAATRCGCPRVDEAYIQLADRLERIASPPTVQLAWGLTALSVAESSVASDALAQRTFERLLARFRAETRVFATGPHRWPRHVACFADQVYPMQAMAHYHARTGDPGALNAARGCARRMCRLQGPAGQWWWHYDTRTGNVVEGYPVYSVHQDSMGPMALLDVAAVCDEDFSDPIRRSLQWLAHSPELGTGVFEQDRPVLCERRPVAIRRNWSA